MAVPMSTTHIYTGCHSLPAQVCVSSFRQMDMSSKKRTWLYHGHSQFVLNVLADWSDNLLDIWLRVKENWTSYIFLRGCNFLFQKEGPGPIRFSLYPKDWDEGTASPSFLLFLFLLPPPPLSIFLKEHTQLRASNILAKGSSTKI